MAMIPTQLLLSRIPWLKGRLTEDTKVALHLKSYSDIELFFKVLGDVSTSLRGTMEYGVEKFINIVLYVDKRDDYCSLTLSDMKWFTKHCSSTHVLYPLQSILSPKPII